HPLRPPEPDPRERGSGGEKGRRHRPGREHRLLDRPPLALRGAHRRHARQPAALLVTAGAALGTTKWMTLDELRVAAAGCTNCDCDLYRNATQTVFGEGQPGTRLMLLGEQPGDKEDLEGRPFVGPAGRLLDQ